MTTTQPIKSMYFRIKRSNDSPPQNISAATKKNLAPRPIKENNRKGTNAMDRIPAVIVNNLYGMGVNPAIKIIQIP